MTADLKGKKLKGLKALFGRLDVFGQMQLAGGSYLVFFYVKKKRSRLTHEIQAPDYINVGDRIKLHLLFMRMFKKKKRQTDAAHENVDV